jgi:hypothetical protein
VQAVARASKETSTGKTIRVMKTIYPTYLEKSSQKHRHFSGSFKTISAGEITAA